MADRSTKIAIGLGLGLAAFSGVLILAGAAISWGAGLFSDSSGVSFGSSIANAGWLIIGIMVTILFIVIGVWIYDKLRSDSGGYYY